MSETVPAYLDEELDLTELERVEAAALARVPGAKQPTVTGLLEHIRRYGREDTIEQTALLLPTEQYKRVVAANRAADYPDRPKIRRRRR